MPRKQLLEIIEGGEPERRPERASMTRRHAWTWRLQDFLEGVFASVDLPDPQAPNTITPESHSSTTDTEMTIILHRLRAGPAMWCALSVSVSLLVGSTSALAADPIKIAVSGPFTGGSSSMGISMRDGVRLAIDEINKSGGVLGRPFIAVERDDEAKN